MGKYTVWVDYGLEGWHPNEYETLEECLSHQNYGYATRITKDVKFEITELEELTKEKHVS